MGVGGAPKECGPFIVYLFDSHRGRVGGGGGLLGGPHLHIGQLSSPWVTCPGMLKQSMKLTQMFSSANNEIAPVSPFFFFFFGVTFHRFDFFSPMQPKLLNLIFLLCFFGGWVGYVCMH